MERSKWRHFVAPTHWISGIQSIINSHCFSSVAYNTYTATATYPTMPYAWHHPLYRKYSGMPLDKMNSMEEVSDGRGREGCILLSPPDVREVRQFICLLDDPVNSSGIMATGFNTGMGICRKPTTSFPSGVSGSLSGVRCRVNNSNVPVTNGRPTGDFILLLFRLQSRIALWDWSAETQNGAQTPPILFTLGLDTPCDGFFDFLSTSQQDVH